MDLPQGFLPSILMGLMLLKDQVALITGSGRGIGRAIAHLFAKEGAAVFLTARTKEQLDSTTAEIFKGGGRAGYLAADLSREADCAQAVAAAREKFGRIDILVNNAGHYGPVAPVEDYPLEDFDKVIAVHLRAAFLLSKLVLPEMYARQYGVILNISSLSAKAAYSWGSGYAAAKAGMLGLTRVTAAEAARKGVRVNAICPGPVSETRMSKELGCGFGEAAWHQPRRATGRLSERLAARPRANGGRNCPRRAFPLFRPGERHRRAIHQRRRRRGLLLSRSSSRHGQLASAVRSCRRLRLSSQTSLSAIP